MSNKKNYWRHIRRSLRQLMPTYGRVLLLSIIFIVFVSCVTNSHSYVSEHLQPFIVNDVFVRVEADLVEDKSAQNQIKQMVEPLFYDSNSEKKDRDNDQTALHIHVIQRSLMEGISPVYSVFIAVSVKDSQETVLVSEHSFLSGNKTLLSAKNQYMYIIPLVQKIVLLQGYANNGTL